MVSPAQSRLIQAMLTPAATASKIDSAVAAKALNAQRQEGAAVLKLLDSAANIRQEELPAGPLGNLLDVSA
jgi:hypothetical protein